MAISKRRKTTPKAAKKPAVIHSKPRRANPDKVLAGPAEGKLEDIKGKLEHTGNWIVLSPIKYTHPNGSTVHAGVHQLDEYGQPEYDEETGEIMANVLAAQDISFSIARDLHERKVLAPELG